MYLTSREYTQYRSDLTVTARDCDGDGNNLNLPPVPWSWSWPQFPGLRGLRRLRIVTTICGSREAGVLLCPRVCPTALLNDKLTADAVQHEARKEIRTTLWFCRWTNREVSTCFSSIENQDQQCVYYAVLRITDGPSTYSMPCQVMECPECDGQAEKNLLEALTQPS